MTTPQLPSPEGDPGSKEREQQAPPLRDLSVRQLIAELARAEDALRATPSRTWDLDADGGSPALEAHHLVAELHRRHTTSNQDLPSLLTAEPDSIAELPHPARAAEPTAEGRHRKPAPNPAPGPPDDGTTPADGTTPPFDGLVQPLEVLLEAARELARSDTITDLVDVLVQQVLAVVPAARRAEAQLTRRGRTIAARSATAPGRPPSSLLPGPGRKRLSLPLQASQQDDHPITGTVTIYTDTVTGFDQSETAASILVGHAEAHLARILAQEHATHLEDALRSNRTIGVAIGLVMAAHDLSEEQGFEMLRVISQNTNRKLALVAADITHARRTKRP